MSHFKLIEVTPSTDMCQLHLEVEKLTKAPEIANSDVIYESGLELKEQFIDELHPEFLASLDQKNARQMHLLLSTLCLEAVFVKYIETQINALEEFRHFYYSICENPMVKKWDDNDKAFIFFSKNLQTPGV